MDLIALLLAGMVAVSVLAFGWNVFLNWRFRQGVRRAARIESVDVSAAEHGPPSAIQPLHAALLVRGFRRLGEVGVSLPGRDPYPMWVLVNPEQHVHVELAVVRDRGYAAFVTWFADDAVVETHYPAGAAVDAPDFRAQVVRESLEVALKRHLSVVQTFIRTHGDPVIIDDMPGFLTYSRRYNAHFLPRKLETMRPDTAAPTFANIYGLLVLAAGLAARLAFHVPDFPLLAGMFALLTPAILYDVFQMVRRRRPK